MNNNNTKQLNHPEEKRLTKIEETKIKEYDEHFLELVNCIDSNYYISVTPSTRLVLRTSEIILDRHSKEFNSILKELVEAFNNDEILKELNTNEVETPETITIPKHSYLGYMVNEMEKEQELNPIVITEDNINNEELFTIPFNDEFYISEYDNNRETVIKALKKKTGKEQVTYSDLKQFIKGLIFEIRDNFSFLEDEVNREIDFIIRDEEEGGL